MSLLTQISNTFSKKRSDQLVGISLQQESITLCYLPSLVMTKLAERDSTQNANVQQASFQTLKVNQLDYSSAITQLQTDINLAGKCHIVLNAQQSQIVQVDKPNVPAAEINSALKWQIKDLVTIPPENMVLDYFDGPVLAGGKEKINVVCSPINELKKIVETANQNEMEVVSIIIEEFAFANLLPTRNDACLLVCQQPNEEIVLLIV